MNATANCGEDNPFTPGLLQAEQPELLRTVGVTVLVATTLYVGSTLVAYWVLRERFPLRGRQHLLIIANSVLGITSLLMNSAIVDSWGWQVRERHIRERTALQCVLLAVLPAKMSECSC